MSSPRPEETSSEHIPKNVEILFPQVLMYGRTILEKDISAPLMQHISIEKNITAKKCNFRLATWNMVLTKILK